MNDFAARLRDAELVGEGERPHAVEDPEVDRLGPAPLVGRDEAGVDAEDLRRRGAVDVLAAAERLDERRVAREVGEEAQLDLRVVGRDEEAPRRGDEGLPDRAPRLGPHGDVLEVRVVRGEAARRRDRLVEARVDPPVPRDVPREGVDVGPLQLRELAPLEDEAGERPDAPDRQLLEDLRAGRVALRLRRLLEDGVLQLLEEDPAELRRGADVERLSRGRVDLLLEAPRGARRGRRRGPRASTGRRRSPSSSIRARTGRAEARSPRRRGARRGGPRGARGGPRGARAGEGPAGRGRRGPLPSRARPPSRRRRSPPRPSATGSSPGRARGGPGRRRRGRGRGGRDRRRRPRASCRRRAAGGSIPRAAAARWSRLLSWATTSIPSCAKRRARNARPASAPSPASGAATTPASRERPRRGRSAREGTGRPGAHSTWRPASPASTARARNASRASADVSQTGRSPASPSPSPGPGPRLRRSPDSAPAGRDGRARARPAASSSSFFSRKNPSSS